MQIKFKQFLILLLIFSIMACTILLFVYLGMSIRGVGKVSELKQADYLLFFEYTTSIKFAWDIYCILAEHILIVVLVLGSAYRIFYLVEEDNDAIRDGTYQKPHDFSDLFYTIGLLCYLCFCTFKRYRLKRVLVNFYYLLKLVTTSIIYVIVRNIILFCLKFIWLISKICIVFIWKPIFRRISYFGMYTSNFVKKLKDFF